MKTEKDEPLLHVGDRILVERRVTLQLDEGTNLNHLRQFLHTAEQLGIEDDAEILVMSEPEVRTFRSNVIYGIAVVPGDKAYSLDRVVEYDPEEDK